jgi:2-dehydropantoate 2-reductase
MLKGGGNLRIAIMGAGSLGLLFASKLAVVGEDVEIITRTETQAESLRRSGISLEGVTLDIKNGIKATSFENRTGLSQQDHTILDYLVLTVKQSAIDDLLLSYLMSRMASHTTVVCFQNGIGHEEKLLRFLHQSQLLLAITTEGARKLSSTTVAHTGKGITYLGFLGPVEESQSKIQKIFAALLEKAGFEVSLSKNMVTRVWNKLIMNSVINPLTAVLRISNGELLQSPHCRTMMRALFLEAVSVAAAKQIAISDDLWKALLQVCENTAANHSSMLQDIQQGRMTEIENMNGSLLRIAKALKLELPVNQTFYSLVKALENK